MVVKCKSIVGGGSTFEFRAMFMEMTSASTGGSSAADGGLGHCWPANQPVTTVMRFSVRVPVLSEQMAVAPPMVSHAASTYGNMHWMSPAFCIMTGTAGACTKCWVEWT